MTATRHPIVNENDEIISHKHRRDIASSDIYRVSALWVTNSKGDVLLAQHGINKSHGPGEWGPAVAGTVDEGETYEDNIVKEAEEEIGLKDVKPVKALKRRYRGEHNYFCQWFTLTIDKPAEEFTIQEDEVEQVKWFTRQQLETELRTDPDRYLKGLDWPLKRLRADEERSAVVLVHGKDGSPNKSWLPWMKRELEERGFRCEAPAFPPQDDSTLDDWVQVFLKLGVPLQNTTFIAHARGAMALLRWINSLPPEVRIPKVVTASCNFDYQPHRTDGDELYATRLDYADLKRKVQRFIVVHSEDDPYVPIAAGEQLARNLDATFVRLEHAGHFGSSKHEAPELLEQVMQGFASGRHKAK